MLRLLATFNIREYPQQKPKPIILNKALAFEIQMIAGLPVGDTEEVKQEYFLCQECLEMFSVKNLCGQCQTSRETTQQQLDSHTYIENNLVKIENLRSFLFSRHLSSDKEREINIRVIQICESVVSDSLSLPNTEKTYLKLMELLCKTDEINELKIYYEQLAKVIDENARHLKLSEAERRKDATSALKQRISNLKKAKRSGIQLNLNIQKVREINRDLVSKMSSLYASTEYSTTDDIDTVSAVSTCFQDFLEILLESSSELPQNPIGMMNLVETAVKNWRSMSGQARRNYVLQEIINSKNWRDQTGQANITYVNNQISKITKTQ